MPVEVEDALRELGSNLRLARLRRRIPLEEMAIRMQVSVPTLRKLEKGQATVSLGVFALAMWFLDASPPLARIAAPEADAQGLQADLRHLPQRVSRSRRAKPDAAAAVKPKDRDDF
ncbi:MAG TPA: helix-turn-helix domain-containing protein [Roseomonas sp.]|jgi:transcriptional regulator with XRE-family HTH domain